MEYFFDVDPGFGSATAITISTPASQITLPSEVLTNAASLSTGFHVIGVRVRNVAENPTYDVNGDASVLLKPFENSDISLRPSDSQWGITETRLIFVDASQSAIVNVDKIEYFFDTDPGVGLATQVAAFTAANNISVPSESLNSSGLSTGFHILGMRARAEGGDWGITETRLVFIDQSDVGALVNVDQIEYFFDTDPGVGLATQITAFTAANNISIPTESLNSSGLSTGFHVLGMRARTEGGSWGTTETRLVFIDQSDIGALVNIDQIEYFFDVDPGVGAATQTTAFTGANSISLPTESLNSSGLSTGFHVLGMRARTEGGAWGTTETRLVYVDPSNVGGIVNVDQIEYFFDSDPGVGSATLLPAFTATNNVSLMETLNSSGLAAGFHVLGMRGRTEGASWGLTETRLIYVDVNGIASDIVELEYFIDNDPGVGSAANIVVATPGVNIMEDIVAMTDTLAIGNYNIFFRAKNQDDVWGITESRPLEVSASSFESTPATSITSTSFDANWDQGVDVLNYELDVSEDSDFSTFLTGFDSFVTTETSVTVASLDFGTNYYYRVRFRNTSDVLSENSDTIAVKTVIDSLTLADSSALVQIYSALDGSNWGTPVNWETDRLRDWDGVSLDVATRTRVDQVDLNGQGATGTMPNPFTGDAIGGLGAISSMNLHNNQITGLMDFGATSITDLDVSTNQLEFDDLEPLVGISSLTYSPQPNLFFDEDTGGTPIEQPHLSTPSLTVITGGSTNVYTFYRNGIEVTQGSDFNIADGEIQIVAIDYDNMGEFTAEVTNTQLPDLTLQVEPQIVWATADLEMTIVDANDNPLEDPVSGYLLEAIRRQQGFDTLEIADNVASSFTFPDVVLGDYLCAIDPSNTELFIPTYFGDEVEWNLAETLFFRSADNVQVRMTEVPVELTGEGVLDVLIEEDFGDEEGRIDARRRAAKRKCGLRRKTGGGRTGQDDEFVLIAYGETDENGEFQFGFLPEGIYRFFVEYPGIPLDESAEVEFEVGEQGVSDTEFKLEAFVTEDGIEISIDRVLGLILEYFKDLEVYPNPVVETLKIRYRHLKSTSVNAQLVDLKGNILWHDKMQQGFDGQKEIDVSGLSKGIYLLHIFDNEDRSGTVVSYRIVINE